MWHENENPRPKAEEFLRLSDDIKKMNVRGRGFYMTQLCSMYEDEKLKARVFKGLKIIVTQI